MGRVYLNSEGFILVVSCHLDLWVVVEDDLSKQRLWLQIWLLTV
jgi:hypothetical protein